MKTIITTLLITLTLVGSASAEPRKFLYEDFHGDFGACVAYKGVPLCTADWFAGQ